MLVLAVPWCAALPSYSSFAAGAGKRSRPWEDWTGALPKVVIARTEVWVSLTDTIHVSKSDGADTCVGGRMSTMRHGRSRPASSSVRDKWRVQKHVWTGAGPDELGGARRSCSGGERV